MSAAVPLSPAPAGARTIRLGLIGDNIARSRAPELHRLAGVLAGVETTYDRLIPRELGADFEQVFAQCAVSGYRGINITYPYKELATGKVEIADPLVRSVGAVNTVVFGPGEPEGHNTDLTGFVAAYRNAFGSSGPGLAPGASARPSPSGSSHSAPRRSASSTSTPARPSPWPGRSKRPHRGWW